MNTERLIQQLAFALELDQLKTVIRRTLLLDKSRYENSAEHSWHVAVMALVLAEHANERVDVGHVLKLLLVHDIVEIDAGDTYVYDTDGQADKDVREQEAAARLFGLLPPEQAAELRAWWDEFEAAVTPEAKFARALDRFQPLLHNYHTQGQSWQTHGVSSDRVLTRSEEMAEGAASFWEHAKALVEAAVEQGFLAR